LRTGTHSTYHGIFAIGRPAGEQYADDAQARYGKHEKYADVVVDDLQSATPRKACKGEHGGYQYKEGGKIEQEVVDFFQIDKLFDKNLEHIGNTLKYTERTYTIGAKTALECSGYSALKVDEEERKNTIECQDSNTYKYKLYE
jgi:hypothetical protein